MKGFYSLNGKTIYCMNFNKANRGETETRLCTKVLQHLDSLVNVGQRNIAPLCQQLLTLVYLSLGKHHSVTLV